MNPTLIKAVIVVTCALVSYSIAIITEQRKKSITKFVLTFLTLGVTLDITSTVLMIMGSSGITYHGFIGWSALLVMLVDAILIWRYWVKNKNATVSRGLNLYTRYAYAWWVVAYIAGAIIAMTLK
ncbi:MAG: hypothetical protein ABSD79_05210 [Dehalococcoidales bacterium]